MFAWLGQFVVRARRAILVAGLVLIAAVGMWGMGVSETGVLSQGGLEDKSSESYRAMERMKSEVGRQDSDVLVLYSQPGTSVDNPEFKQSVTAALEKTRSSPEVEHVESYYDAGLPPSTREALVSDDHEATYAVVRLKGADDDQRMTSYLDLKDAEGGNPLVVPGDEITTQLGGLRPMLDDVNSGITDGLTIIEVVTVPVLFLLLLFVFRSVVAALVPVVVAVIALVFGMAAIRALNEATTISVFSLNVLMFMALGLAVDYGLFMVSRFREELAAGREVGPAVVRTMRTAGRTVLVSGVTVTLALTGLLVFPQAYVRSMAWGGLVGAFFAMVASLTVLPAFLAVIGRKVDALRVPLPRRRREPEGAPETGGWGAVARFVMRRPAVVTVLTVGGLLVLAVPVSGVTFGTSDERTLAKDAPSRVVADRLDDEFAFDARKSLYVLVSGVEGGERQARSAAQELAGRIRSVEGVDAPTVGVVGARAEGGTGSAVVVANHQGEWTSGQARDVVGDIRGLKAPDGAEVLVGGMAADLKDQRSALASHLPLMAAVIIVITMLFMFLAFGSLLVPLMSVVLNIVSIAAAFGPIVLIFQDGHLSGLLDFTSSGFVTGMEPVMMLAFAFGLSMDYSVFLMSRIREEWDTTGDAEQAVVAGVQRTGGIITSAAVLLAVTIGSFALVEVRDMKFIAVGMFIIILLDATVVRLLLVPAVLKLLGPAAWWAPKPLRRFYASYGIKETDGEPAEAAPALSGRH
ncbi:MMPL family transporter [Streptomyces sp. LX-29]|uniref:MMPL family transporter n=1 Tax=Streptomyces sp. LX-29 TaxID=2900152 RepID=UPI00240E18EC|nr:MMPL family transporter [Streptomyces sp. LX-29]WFB08803.1 MMPL family transporter [Streptomyces sp. LX-29]